MSGNDSDSDRTGERGRFSSVSRRHVLAGGLLCIGGVSRLVDSTTSARFSDTESAAGTVRVARQPSLEYQITDQTKNTNAEYAISYQVDDVDNFDRIEIYVDNVPNDQYDPNPGGGDESESFTKYSTQRTVSTSSFGGHSGDTFEFIFEVYKTGESNPTIREVVTNTAGDGQDSGDGNFGNENSPELEWALVEDRTKNDNGDYTVYYEVAKLQNFGEVRVRFEDTEKSTATKTKTNSNSPNGKVSYAKGGVGGDAFDIRIEVLNQNGLVVDQTTISDVADGSDPSGYGDPVRSDSPVLDSFTVTDDSRQNKAEYTLTYQTSQTARFGGARIVFRDTEKSSATAIVTKGSGEPSGTANYSQGGAGNDQFEITVEVLETRSGVTFPVDSGTITDIADGSDP